MITPAQSHIPPLIALLKAVENVLEGWCWPGKNCGDLIHVEYDEFVALQKAFNTFNERRNAATAGDPPDWSAP